MGASLDVSVDYVRFLSEDEAEVHFVLLLSQFGPSGLAQTGHAVLVDGEWKVSRDTWCRLVGMAGVQCPPPEDRPDRVGRVAGVAPARGPCELRTAHARYLVAADGAHSRVRRMLGVEMRDRDGAHRGVQVVFRAPLWQLLGSLRYALCDVTTPTAPGLFLPAGRGDRWVYGPTLPADVEESPDLEPARLAEAIRQGAGVVDLDPHIERIGAFHSPGQLVDRFRVGRTFLVGDAAHRVTPRGGTGMNTALQSGYDLGWKLAWVLLGWAERDLLDTYEAERRVVAEHNLARSTDPNGSRRPVVDELSVDLGGRVAHAWLPSTSGRVSTIDLLGPGWTLFTGPSREAWDAAASPTRAPLTVRALDNVTARTLGVRGDGALLARPDGVPVAVWPSSAGASDLRQAMEQPAVRSAHERAVA